METRTSQPCPLHIGWALAKSYGDFFYTPKSLPHFLLLAKFSSDSKAINKKFYLTARLLAKFSSDSKAISRIFFLTARLLAKFSSDSKAMI